MIKALLLLKCWPVGAALTVLLIALRDLTPVHTGFDIMIFYLLFPPFVAAEASHYLITGPHEYRQWLIDSLMVFYGGWFYGAILMLVIFVLRRSKERENNDAGGISG